jgi:hypothetical protein
MKIASVEPKQVFSIAVLIALILAEFASLLLN